MTRRLTIKRQPGKQHLWAIYEADGTLVEGNFTTHDAAERAVADILLTDQVMDEDEQKSD